MDLELRNVSGDDDFAAVQRGLDEYNDSWRATPTPLNVYAKEDGTLLGGLCALTFWHWLYVCQVWVDAAQRGNGIGRRLMAAAEARRRGCAHVYLDTVSVQAPGFYDKLGYEVIGTLDDYPPGGQKFFMTKKL